MSKFKYYISLGEKCLTSSLLKRNNLKKESYPFDWIFSNLDMIIHCLYDDFQIFLDKKYYTIYDSTYNCNTHTYYYPNNFIVFNHHNPLKDNDYEYFCRCVKRFKNTLESIESKLFIIVYNNSKFNMEDYKNSIKNFNDKLKKYTNNYNLLFILHKNNDQRWHYFEYYENIIFLTVFTCSFSNGVKFEDDKDNEYIDKILLDYCLTEN